MRSGNNPLFQRVRWPFAHILIGILPWLWVATDWNRGVGTALLATILYLVFRAYRLPSAPKPTPTAPTAWSRGDFDAATGEAATILAAGAACAAGTAYVASSNDDSSASSSYDSDPFDQYDPIPITLGSSSDLFEHTSAGSFDRSGEINPTTGLMMVNDVVDTSGNAYGAPPMDSSSPMYDDPFQSSSCDPFSSFDQAASHDCNSGSSFDSQSSCVDWSSSSADCSCSSSFDS